jgi:hypothetical protein
VSTPFRVLRQSPWYAAAIVGVLAVGIALTTVAFAVVDGVLFKPLPFDRSHDLHLLHADSASTPRLEPPAVSLHHATVWRQAAPELAFTLISHDQRTGVAGIDERFLSGSSTSSAFVPCWVVSRPTISTGWKRVRRPAGGFVRC